jgi:hypothetical protein
MMLLLMKMMLLLLLLLLLPLMMIMMTLLLLVIMKFRKKSLNKLYVPRISSPPPPSPLTLTPSYSHPPMLLSFFFTASLAPFMLRTSLFLNSSHKNFNNFSPPGSASFFCLTAHACSTAGSCFNLLHRRVADEGEIMKMLTVGAVSETTRGPGDSPVVIPACWSKVAIKLYYVTLSYGQPSLTCLYSILVMSLANV